MTQEKLEKKIFSILKKIALEDNAMTVDESIIIATSMKNAISFDIYLKRALTDSVISIEEKEQLNRLLTKMYDEAKEQAMKDGVISDEEANLLSKLSQFIEKEKNQTDN